MNNDDFDDDFDDDFECNQELLRILDSATDIQHDYRSIHSYGSNFNSNINNNRNNNNSTNSHTSNCHNLNIANNVNTLLQKTTLNDNKNNNASSLNVLKGPSAHSTRQSTLFEAFKIPNNNTHTSLHSTSNNHHNEYRNNKNTKKEIEYYNSNHAYDPEAAASWIYPTNRAIRDYQLNIVQTCLFTNTLVSLPTGII